MRDFSAHRDDDPPRRRANEVHGHGTWDNDQPVCGVVGRDGGPVRLSVARDADRVTLEGMVVASSGPEALVNTDESLGCRHLAETGRGHATVCHKIKESARDGDGVREVHDNTPEGIWTGLRDFLRTFPGVNKKYLHQYVGIFQWKYNLKRAPPEFLRALLGIRRATDRPT